ncbi:MAG: hypothetical protein WCO48_01635 [Candidatus Taylorbacteria bacterium]
MKPTNIVLVLIGLACIAVGLFRQYPIRISSSQFLWNVVPMAAMLVLVICLAYKYNDVPVSVLINGKSIPYSGTALGRGLNETMRIASSFWFTIVLLMPLIGFSTAITPVFQEQITKMLTGWQGWFCSIPLAFTSAGGSGWIGPIRHMWFAVKQSQPLLLYILNITPLVGFTIFQIRILGLGPEIANKMYIMGFASAIWLIPMFLIYKIFFFKM